MVRGKKTYCSSARGGRTSKRVICNSEGINRYLMQSKGVEVDPSPPSTNPTALEVPPTDRDSSKAPSVMIRSTHDIHPAPSTDGDSSRAPLMMIPSTHDTQPAPSTASEATDTSVVPAIADATSGGGILTQTEGDALIRIGIKLELVPPHNPKNFYPGDTVRFISKKILHHLPMGYTTWSKYFLEIKDILFDEFMRKYTFAAGVDRVLVRHVWEIVAGARLHHMLFLMRKEAKKKNNTDDLAQTIDNLPDGMSTMKWRSLVDKWKREVRYCIHEPQTINSGCPHRRFG
ncbi:putative Imidazole glycerol phosphate synthase subunit HisF [Cocos nucifera]|nr:putative Imidazole glycerol phosphate synthase subunit HisF [Cocos nucifera]